MANYEEPSLKYYLTYRENGLHAIAILLRYDVCLLPGCGGGGVHWSVYVFVVWCNGVCVYILWRVTLLL